MKTITPLFLLAVIGCKGTDDLDNPPTTLTVTLEHTGSVYAFVDAGAISALAPGDSDTFEVRAGIGQRLSIATGLDQSNDWFAGAGSEGMPLWTKDRTPVEGELNQALLLWDAGTEADSPLGEGPDQGARQMTAAQGSADANNKIRVVDDYVVQDWLSITSSYLGDQVFEITISNTSLPLDTAGGPVDLTWMPGTWVIHHGQEHDGLWPLYNNGQTASEAMQSVAEDADNTELLAWAESEVGVTIPLGGVFWVVTSQENPLFAEGQDDYGQGLQSVCEDGAPADLFAYWGAGDATSFGLSDAPEGIYEPAPVLPGERFVFDVQTYPGDALHLAWMYVESNDICFTLADSGLPLWDGDTLISGVQMGLQLTDAGSEVNQEPGLGDTQAPRQTDKNTGPEENGAVREVDDGRSYGVADELIKMSVQ